MVDAFKELLSVKSRLSGPMFVRKDKLIVHTETLDQGNIHKEKKRRGRSRCIIEYCRVFRIVNSPVCVTEKQGANDYNVEPVGNPS
jgi:hypothetical protein